MTTSKCLLCPQLHFSWLIYCSVAVPDQGSQCQYPCAVATVRLNKSLEVVCIGDIIEFVVYKRVRHIHITKEGQHCVDFGLGCSVAFIGVSVSNSIKLLTVTEDSIAGAQPAQIRVICQSEYINGPIHIISSEG